MKIIVSDMAKHEGVTEALKAADGVGAPHEQHSQPRRGNCSD